jgi:hypothetical protein
LITLLSGLILTGQILRRERIYLGRVAPAEQMMPNRIMMPRRRRRLTLLLLLLLQVLPLPIQLRLQLLELQIS